MISQRDFSKYDSIIGIESRIDVSSNIIRVLLFLFINNFGALPVSVIDEGYVDN